LLFWVSKKAEVYWCRVATKMPNFTYVVTGCTKNHKNMFPKFQKVTRRWTILT